MRASVRFANFFDSLVSFGRDAIRHPSAAMFAVLMTSFGLYVMAVLVWLVFLMVASLFGYEKRAAIEEDRRHQAIISAYRQAFCRRERIPPAYCNEIFTKSAAFDEAIRVAVEETMARDKRDQENARFWGLLEMFELPVKRR